MTIRVLTPWEEHRFWVEILQDHAYFVRDHLSVSEQEPIRLAQSYIDAFQSLYNELHALDKNGDYRNPGLVAFARKAWPVANGYFQLEGSLQRARIANRVNLNLSPTYLNGTLNENQEYLRLLGYMTHGQAPPPLALVDLMDLWLEDQLGHAILLINVLDPAEHGIRARAQIHLDAFRALFSQNEVIRGYLRFSPPGIPVQLRLARETLAAVNGFYEFVLEIIHLYRSTALLERTTLRFLEHHLPETCYFIRKLADLVPDVTISAHCSLTKPTFVDNQKLPTNPPVV
ncbi:DUF2935 domain-containing protein [Paenibacillus methanolicus]|uniref:DUF2935 family protein n=1 Tax=Paenibacillus methanolicus TaxID=582686 RepID=A0A5S5CJK0_9BACL|nr:DUF2935 domain-containing protein [Paenibacillus methanolicus]TYP79077.1 protein of unknown function (DUF2935) [Paenibacillus methanolicus]